MVSKSYILDKYMDAVKYRVPRQADIDDERVFGCEEDAWKRCVARAEFNLKHAENLVKRAAHRMAKCRKKIHT